MARMVAGYDRRRGAEAERRAAVQRHADRLVDEGYSPVEAELGAREIVRAGGY